MIYTVLDSDDAIKRKMLEWGEKRSLSVDFECEFNLHVYGEHLCLIQIYDGEGYYLIDVLSPLVTEKGLAIVLTSPNEKVWFASQSDASLVYKKYKIRINNIYDIRVLALNLGYSGNLLSLIKEFLNIDVVINKKKNQTANWLKRPLDSELIEYALLDVKYLFDLKDVLLKRVISEKKESSVNEMMKAITKVKEPKPGWKNIANYKRMSKDEKRALMLYFIDRDKIAKKFNVPGERVLSKKTLLSLSLKIPKSREEVEIRVSNEPKRFRKMVAESIWQSTLTLLNEQSVVHP